ATTEIYTLSLHDALPIFNVTEHPTAVWTAQQLVDAFPDESAPVYLLRDRDRVSLAKTPSAGQVVDLSALIRRQLPSYDQHAARPTPTLAVPLRRPPAARPRESRP